MRNIAILTTFVGSDPAYSLNRVVQDQITMLTRHGYRPRVLVFESGCWQDPPEMYGHPAVDLYQLPNVPPPGDPAADAGFDRDVELLTDALRHALAEADVVLTHDIIYQPSALKVNLAARLVADDFPDLVWLQWIHSATSPHHLHRGQPVDDVRKQALQRPWPNSFPVVMNAISIPRIAENFGYDERDVKTVPHPVDICRFFGLTEVSSRLYEKKKLHQADYVATYPVRLDRGKQVEWVIKILARLKAGGQQVRLLVMDFHSTGGDKCTYRQELKDLAREWELDDIDLTFLSEFDETLRRHAPHAMVRELFCLSNLFVLPSRSETYSLAAQEAAVAGNLLVLNHDFPPMRDVFGPHALYFQFSANMDKVTYLDGETSTQYHELALEQRPDDYPSALVEARDGIWYVRGDAAYADYIAKRIRCEFIGNPILAQRHERMRNRNVFSVFKNHLEPLLYMDPGTD